MRKFSFRLEPVLRHRITKEEEAILAQARTEQELMKRQEELLKTNLRLQGTLLSNQIGKVDILDNFNMVLYRDFLCGVRSFQEGKVNTVKERLEKCRAVTIQNRKERMVIERLKQRQFNVYRSELNCQEQKDLDEQGLQVFLRKKPTE